MFLPQGTLPSLSWDPSVSFSTCLSQTGCPRISQNPRDLPWAPGTSKRSDFMFYRYLRLHYCRTCRAFCVYEVFRKHSFHPFHLNKGMKSRSRVWQKPWASCWPYCLNHLQPLLPKATMPWVPPPTSVTPGKCRVGFPFTVIHSSLRRWLSLFSGF